MTGKHYWARNWYDAPLGYGHAKESDVGQTEKCPSHNFWPIFPYSDVRASAIKYSFGKINPYETEQRSKFTNFTEGTIRGSVRPSVAINYGCGGQGCGRAGFCQRLKCGPQPTRKCFEEEELDFSRRLPNLAREIFVKLKSSCCNSDGLDLVCNNFETNEQRIWKRRRLAIRKGRCCDTKCGKGCCRNPGDCCPPPAGGCHPSRRCPTLTTTKFPIPLKIARQCFDYCKYPYISRAHLDDDDYRKRALLKVPCHPMPLHLIGLLKDKDKENEERRGYQDEGDDGKNKHKEDKSQTTQSSSKNENRSKQNGNRTRQADDDVLVKKSKKKN